MSYIRRSCTTAAAAYLGTVAQATFLSSPAAAAGLFLGGFGLGAEVTMDVQSFQEKKYSATIPQQYDFSCGSAALATLLTYSYNINVSEQDIFKDMFENGDKDVISSSGFSLLDIKNYLTRRGLESNGYRAPLERLAAVQNQPTSNMKTKTEKTKAIQSGRSIHFSRWIPPRAWMTSSRVRSSSGGR